MLHRGPGLTLRSAANLPGAILPAAIVLLASAVLMASVSVAIPADNLNPLKPLPETARPMTTAPPLLGADGLPGDTMETAIPVTSLPFVATGNTCSFTNDYGEMCPYGTWAPDVVYVYTPTQETNISVELCDSLYDTLIFLYQTDSHPFHLLACNDDSCGDDGYKSSIDRLHVVPGFTYYIVVDGYTSACGDYVLQVNDLGPCIPPCTEIWETEGEPVCGDDYEDQYNAGCDVYPFAFSPIEPSNHVIRICGTSGWYRVNDSPQVDRDWYEIQVPATSQIDVFCEAEFDVSLRLYDGNSGCGQPFTIDQDDGYWCETMAEVSAQLEPGRYWIVVKPVSGGGGCGLGYRLWIDGYIPAPAGVGDQTFIAEAQLQVASPNPFSSTTMINYNLARSGTVRIAIYDVSGRLIRTLASESVSAGPGRIQWNGKDDAGRQVASGVYRCRLDTDSGTVVRPIIRLR
jgi:hypothetical protein